VTWDQKFPATLLRVPPAAASVIHPRFASAATIQSIRLITAVVYRCNVTLPGSRCPTIDP